MITREQVADLQPGDVVELVDDRWPVGTVLRGPLWEDVDSGHLRCAASYVRTLGGDLPAMTESNRTHRTLTVVSRAPRPLYVNHPRTEPVPGDVVRDADDDSPQVWVWWPANERDVNAWTRAERDGEWSYLRNSKMPARLRLLVDGETGMTVPS